MNKILKLLIFYWIISISALHSQQVQYINANMINAGIGIGGNLFSRLDSIYPTPPQPADTLALWKLYEVPKGSNKRDGFTASLWMQAIDSSNISHCAAQVYKEGGSDFYDGPIADRYDSLYDNYYKRVFKVTKSQIDSDRLMSFPVSAGALDSSILLWPGYGNPYVTANFGVNILGGLAPFVDLDNDGIYDPMKGDYPAICGDEAIFFVFNDNRGPHGETGGLPIGVEVRGMAYEFSDSTSLNFIYPKRAVNNTVFVQYDIENKSTLHYDSFYLGLFELPDVGCVENDYVGCDTARNLVFGYNATTPDLNCLGEDGYSPYQAAHGAILLNIKMESFIYFYEGTSGGSTVPDPVTCGFVKNYLSGRWYDGTPITCGGTGYNYNGTVTNYCFPGDPNDTGQWTEVQISGLLGPGQRGMLPSTGLMNFNPGEIKHFDFAFCTAYDSTATLNSIVDTLKRDADIVQAFYNNAIIPCRTQLDTLLSVKSINTGKFFWVSVFPNPVENKIEIELSNEASNEIQISIFAISGQILSQQTINPAAKTELDVSNLSPGMYFIQLQDGQQSWVRKFVKE